eukprot:TRINITY_DN66284_c7_g4_i1.p1 TRINITY_DN66284_c7_g4~~TRINITY_DN66284_c7_g4_i1.p1  ORF type:complete len:414 (-),score=151.25 TRINITY_DN66284_c7_g4_i1:804-1934(-)
MMKTTASRPSRRSAASLSTTSQPFPMTQGVLRVRLNKAMRATLLVIVLSAIGLFVVTMSYLVTDYLIGNFVCASSSLLRLLYDGGQLWALFIRAMIMGEFATKRSRIAVVAALVSVHMGYVVVAVDLRFDHAELKCAPTHPQLVGVLVFSYMCVMTVLLVKFGRVVWPMRTVQIKALLASCALTMFILFVWVMNSVGVSGALGVPPYTAAWIVVNLLGLDALCSMAVSILIMYSMHRSAKRRNEVRERLIGMQRDAVRKARAERRRSQSRKRAARQQQQQQQQETPPKLRLNARPSLASASTQECSWTQAHLINSQSSLPAHQPLTPLSSSMMRPLGGPIPEKQQLSRDVAIGTTLEDSSGSRSALHKAQQQHTNQ